MNECALETSPPIHSLQIAHIRTRCLKISTSTLERSELGEILNFLFSLNTQTNLWANRTMARFRYYHKLPVWLPTPKRKYLEVRYNISYLKSIAIQEIIMPISFDHGLL
jgi:hypothetical protein